MTQPPRTAVIDGTSSASYERDVLIVAAVRGDSVGPDLEPVAGPRDLPEVTA